MPIIYDKWITISGQIYDYSTGSNITQFTINHSLSDFNFRFVVDTASYYSPKPSAMSFSKAKLKGKLPDATEFMIEDIDVVYRTDGPYKAYDGTGCDVVTVTFDSRFTSQIGTSAYVLILCDSGGSEVASWRFKVRVVDDSGEAVRKIERTIDLFPHGNPLDIYLNQNDSNFVLAFKVVCSKGVWTKDRYQYGDVFVRTYIRGVRPDGYKIDKEVGFTYSGVNTDITNYTITVDGRSDSVGEILTSIPGDYIVAFTLQNSVVSPKIDLNTTQRVRIHVEPIRFQEDF